MTEACSRITVIPWESQEVLPICKGKTRVNSLYIHTIDLSDVKRMVTECKQENERLSKISNIRMIWALPYYFDITLH